MKITRGFRRHIERGNYRAYVGPSRLYDAKGVWQFIVLCLLGLREHHHLLEIACGSLRAGRLFIPYLKPGHYCGVDAEAEIVVAGLEGELGAGISEVKHPTFAYNSQFDFSSFGRKFDYILAHNIVIHLPQIEVGKMLGAAAGVLKPEGFLVANYIDGQDSEKETVTYPEIFFHSTEMIKQLVERVGLRFTALMLAERHPKSCSFLGTHNETDVETSSIIKAISNYWKRHDK